MKHVVILFLGIFYCIPLVFSQELKKTGIPAPVADKFMLLYPDAKCITWHFTNDHFKADFKNNKMATTALIAADGTLLQTETQIKVTALPEQALAYFEEKPEDPKIEMATIIEDENGIITFEAVADKVDYTFDSSGQVVETNEVAINAHDKED